jgi:outer membrane protein OmpA-like peptidoglycan-associated protein
MQGATGATGAQGSTLYGPTGATGRTGQAGSQGIVGDEGKQGRTTEGVAGAAGIAGASGAQGVTGAQGDTGVAGIVGQWTPYKEFNFAFNDSQIQDRDSAKIAEIATYMKANPSLQLLLDGSMDPNGTDPKDQKMSDRRVESIRIALIDAGVSSDRIKTGALANSKTRHDRHVEVLFASAN